MYLTSWGVINITKTQQGHHACILVSFIVSKWSKALLLQQAAWTGGVRQWSALFLGTNIFFSLLFFTKAGNLGDWNPAPAFAGI
jgi:hypothetical protein